MMEMRTLGGSGIHVSRMCLGAMMFGAMGETDRAKCAHIIDRAIDAGINFIDTADVYSRGESEQIVGDAIKGRRDKLVIATKFGLPMSRDPNQRGGARRWIMRAVDDSLKRLQTDYIDLYQIHRHDPHTDIEEILFTFTDLVREGKIRAFGSSMFPADRIVESHWTAERRGQMRFRCEQAEYSIFARDVERFVLPACRRHGMGVICWSPLNGGFLSGKYRAPADLSGDNRIARYGALRPGGFDPESDIVRRKLAIVEALDALAREAGITLPQLATAFTLEHPDVTSTIIGPRTIDQLEGLLSAGELRLPADTLDAIDGLVAPGSYLGTLVDCPSGTDRAQRRRPT